MTVHIRYDEDYYAGQWWAECKKLKLKARAPSKNEVLSKMQSLALKALAGIIDRGEMYGYSYVIFDERCLRLEREKRAAERTKRKK